MAIELNREKLEILANALDLYERQASGSRKGLAQDLNKKIKNLELIMFNNKIQVVYLKALYEFSGD